MERVIIRTTPKWRMFGMQFKRFDKQPTMDDPEGIRDGWALTLAFWWFVWTWNKGI